ncbi:MAG: hypothetical protein WBM01_09285, partial [Mycobacterium sp.]
CVMTLSIPGNVGSINHVYEHYRVSNQPGLRLSMNSLDPASASIATAAPSEGRDSLVGSDIARGVEMREAMTPH